MAETTVLKATASSRNAVVVVAFAALAATVASLGGPFILDDLSKILGNPDIRHLDGLLSRLVYPYEATQVLERNDPSRPVVFALYALVHAVAGLEPWAYRLVNLLLHAGNAALLLLILRPLLRAHRAKQADSIAMVTALLFAVAPIQTGTASYCYALSDVLSATFSLAVLYVGVERRRVGYAAVLLGLALLTKQSAVVLPALVVLWDWSRYGRGDAQTWGLRVRSTAVFVGVVGVCLGWRWVYFGSLGDLEGRGNTAELWTYAAFQPYAMLRYVQLSLVPYGLAIDHYVGPATVSAALRYGALGVVGASVVGVVFYAHRLLTGRAKSPYGQLLWFSAVFYGLCVAPTSSFFPTVDFLVERRVYLANAALYLVVAATALAIVERWAQGRGRAIATLYLAALFAVSQWRNYEVRDAEGAWRSVLAVYPNSVRALINHGIALRAQGRDEEAARCYLRVLERNPADAFAVHNLATLYNSEPSKLFDRKKAEQLFETAIRLRPTFAPAYYELGRLAQLAGQGPLAEARYFEALQFAPNDVQTHNNLGLLYLHQGRLTDSRRALERAQRLDANYEPARVNLSLLAAREQAKPLGVEPAPASRQEIALAEVDPSIVIPVLLEAVGKEPNSLTTRLQFADYCFDRKLDCAKEQYEAALKLHPKHERALSRLRQLK